MSPAALRWQSDRRAERKAGGLCFDCGTKSKPFRRCPDCRRAMNVKRNAANARRRAEALPDVPAELGALEDLGPLADDRRAA